MSNHIDLALAIWQIDPSATYVLNRAVPPHHIIEWRGPGLEPTVEELYAAWLRCTCFEVDEVHRVNRLEPSIGEVVADGLDTASIMVRTGGAEANISVLVRDQEVIVSLIDGEGVLAITADTPSLNPHIVVQALDQVTYGNSACVIRAV